MKVLITLIFLIISNFNLQAALATHGMVLFGKEVLYAYHLPMFHQAHNKQMVFTFDIPEEVKAQITHFEESNFLTFVPAPFDLEKFIAHPFALRGDLYSGHFEKDGALIMTGITLSNPKIIYLKNLVAPSLGHIETYLFYGTTSDIYALHLLDGGTKLDQIFKMSASGEIEKAMNSHSLTTKSLLQLGSIYPITYTVNVDPCKPPTRLCGSEPEMKRTYVLANFKVESLYFQDDIMPFF